MKSVKTKLLKKSKNSAKHPLDALREKELEASLPLKATATNLVFGAGKKDAEVFFLGEAPGRNEDLQGLPFIGQAGKVLDNLLAISGLKRSDVFITSLLHYRPPQNRDPQPSEIAAFQPFVDEQIKIIKPKIIVTLGRHPMKKFLPDAIISTVHGKPYEMTINGKQITIFPMFHPAAALYNRGLLKMVEEDFRKLKEIISHQ